MHAARFLVVMLVSLASCLAGVGAINLLVDPYDIFGMPRIAGFNEIKSNASTRVSMVKAYQIERVTPRTVLFGTSRVDIGINPNHAAWPKNSHPVYNFAYPGTSLRKIPLQLRHAAQVGPIKLAMVGLEFQDFLNSKIAVPGEPTEVERRLNTGDNNISEYTRNTQKALDRFNATLTLKATIDSVETIARQWQKYPDNVAANGLSSENIIARFARSDGHNDLFAQTDLNIIKSMDRDARALLNTPHSLFPDLAYVRTIIEFCRQRNIELHLFIPPYHADYLEIVDAAGLWDRFENLKLALAELVAEYQASGTSSRIVLWDFASYDAYSTEVLPPKGDLHSTLRWYWEPAHFKKALGDVMLSRMLNSGEQSFGAKLSPELFPDYLAKGRESRSAYRIAHPEEAKRIAEFIRSYRQRRDEKSLRSTAKPY